MHATFGSIGAQVISLLGALLLALIAALHVGWAIGLKLGSAAVVPEKNGAPAFRPSRGATVIVALGLAGMAVVLLSLGNWLAPLPSVRPLGIACSVIFALRTVGDFRQVGLFKRPSPTAFARLDTLLYTPLCFVLAAAFFWQR